MCDGEKPASTGNVPIKLVVAGEESDFTVHRVGQRVGVLARGQDYVLISYVNPLAVALVFNIEFLRLAIAQYLQNFEMNDVPVAQPILIASRKVAINPMTNVYRRAAHEDGLCYQQRGVLPDMDVAVVFQDLFPPNRPELVLLHGRARPTKTEDCAPDHEGPERGRQVARNTLHITSSSK